MKKTININLAGTAFIIDENAYDVLHRYLENLKNRFGNTTERAEIMEDIEARLAEMFAQKLGSRKEVIGLTEVEETIAVMGTPEDIAGESGANAADSGNAFSSKNYDGKRRLFRDKEDKVVSGVISGLCHYFGINDPVWARIAAALLVIAGFGFPVILYFLLMIVVPEAETAAEKLQMKGEPVNVGSIEREIKDAANRAAESVKKVADKTVFERLFSGLGKVIVVLLKIFIGFWVFIGLVVLFALLAALFGVSVAGNSIISQAPHMLVDERSVVTMLQLGLILFIATPVLALVYAAIRLVFGIKEKVYALRVGLSLLWVTGIVLLLAAGSKIAGQFRQTATRTETISLPVIDSTSAYRVQIVDESGQPADTDGDFTFNINPWDGLVINGYSIDELKQIPIDEPRLDLVPSATDSFFVQVLYHSKGKTKTEALANTTYVDYPVTLRDGQLQLPDFLFLSKDKKWRAQNVRIIIGIPEGKTLEFGNNIDRWAAVVKNNRRYDDTPFANTVWTNKGGKIRCIRGETHFNESDWDDEENEVEIEKVVTETVEGDAESNTATTTIVKEKNGKRIVEKKIIKTGA